MARSVCLAVKGDGASPATFGGTPYFVADALGRAGYSVDHWDLRGRYVSLRKIAYAATCAFQGSPFRGFQFSRISMPRNFQSDCDVLVSHFQLVPRVAQSRTYVVYYIDATLAQLQREYGLGLSRRQMRKVILRERVGYQNARAVFAKSEWALRSLREEYGVPESKLKLMLPGANLPSSCLPERHPSFDGSSLRLLFVGKDWRRKGLERILAAIRNVRRMGLEVVVDVVGAARDDLGELDALYPECMRTHGFLDKYSDSEAWRSLYESAHFGILMSTNEAAGISVREFLRAGVPVITTTAGGAPEMVPPRCGVAVPPEDLGALEDTLARLATDVSLASLYSRGAREVSAEVGYDRILSPLFELLETYGGESE